MKCSKCKSNMCLFVFATCHDKPILRLQVFIVSFQRSENNRVGTFVSHGFISSISYPFLSNNYNPKVETHFAFSFAGQKKWGFTDRCNTGSYNHSHP